MHLNQELLYGSSVFSSFRTFDNFFSRSGLGVTLGSKVFLINFGQASEVGINKYWDVVCKTVVTMEMESYIDSQGNRSGLSMLVPNLSLYVHCTKSKPILLFEAQLVSLVPGAASGHVLVMTVFISHQWLELEPIAGQIVLIWDRNWKIYSVSMI